MEAASAMHYPCIQHAARLTPGPSNRRQPAHTLIRRPGFANRPRRTLCRNSGFPGQLFAFTLHGKPANAHELL